jgi:hypothetical protein
LGNLSFGGRLPGFVARTGLTNLQVFLCDKVIPMFPPYETAEQIALLRSFVQLESTATYFSRDEVRKNYLAGGGSDAEFEHHWAREIAQRKKYHDAVSTRQLDAAGGMLMYLVSGSKQ